MFGEFEVVGFSAIGDFSEFSRATACGCGDLLWWGAYLDVHYSSQVDASGMQVVYIRYIVIIKTTNAVVISHHIC